MRSIPSNAWDVSWNTRKFSPITLEDEKWNPFRDWSLLNDFDGSKKYLDPKVKGPYTRKQKFTLDGTNVDGIRASCIYGGSDQYLITAKKRGVTLHKIYEEARKATGSVAPSAYLSKLVLDHFFVIPTFYTFTDAIHMADGTKVVRIWDASVYPMHDLYVDGTRRGGNEFKEGRDWKKTGVIQPRFKLFGSEAMAPGLTPFDRWGTRGYKTGWNKGTGKEPVAVYDDAGSRLTGIRVIEKTKTPLFPPEIR